MTEVLPVATRALGDLLGLFTGLMAMPLRSPL